MSLPLSDRAKASVEDFIDYAIAQVDDAFRNAPAKRLGVGSPYFQRQLLLVDFWGDRRFHRLDFVINDEHAHYGVLLVVYVEYL
jgi:hypothetical protein